MRRRDPPDAKSDSPLLADFLPVDRELQRVLRSAQDDPLGTVVVTEDDGIVAGLACEAGQESTIDDRSKEGRRFAMRDHGHAVDDAIGGHRDGSGQRPAVSAEPHRLAVGHVLEDRRLFAPADGVAIVAARREGPLWTLRWNLASDGQNWSWRSSDQELMFALAQGIHQMTDQLAAVNTIAASEQGLGTVDITIGKLNGATDYAACLEYLQKLSLVTAVEILGADPDRVHFRLHLNASSEHLAEAFDRGSVLLPARAGNEYDYEYLR